MQCTCLLRALLFHSGVFFGLPTTDCFSTVVSHDPELLFSSCFFHVQSVSLSQTHVMDCLQYFVCSLSMCSPPVDPCPAPTSAPRTMSDTDDPSPPCGAAPFSLSAVWCGSLLSVRRVVRLPSLCPPCGAAPFSLSAVW